jgi:hypothetical protein
LVSVSRREVGRLGRGRARPCEKERGRGGGEVSPLPVVPTGDLGYMGLRGAVGLGYS